MNDFIGYTLEYFKSLSADTQRKIIMEADVEDFDNVDKAIVAINCQLFILFCEEAEKIARHRDHYSARTIVEVMRHNSIASDVDEHYKINNNIVPYFSAMSMSLFPSLNGLFSRRRNT